MSKNNPTNEVQARSYMVTRVDGGEWMHAPGSNFLFAFLKDSWSDDIKAKVGASFIQALSMSDQIKEAVKETSGETVVNGLYLLDQPAMTKAMNSIDGMGLTSTSQRQEKGNGTATVINGDFFNAVLGGLGGNVAPMMQYLNSQMGDVQAQTKKSTVTAEFGTVIGFVSLMPILNIPITSFQYIYSSQETSQWFVKVNCGSHERYSYDYRFVTANYNYNDPTDALRELLG